MSRLNLRGDLTRSAQAAVAAMRGRVMLGADVDGEQTEVEFATPGKAIRAAQVIIDAALSVAADRLAAGDLDAVVVTVQTRRRVGDDDAILAEMVRLRPKR